MSLKKYLENNADVRERFRAEFKKPRLPRKPATFIAPSSSRYMLIGTAYDYLLRFVIEFENQDRNIAADAWYADKVVKRIKEQIYTRDADGYWCNSLGMRITDEANEFFNNSVANSP